MRSRVLAVLVAALVPLAASGCQSDDGPTASPSGSRSAPAADATSASPPSDSPSASASGVPPAAGPAVQLKHSMRFRFPEGESHHSGGGSLIVVGGLPVDGGSFDITASEIESTNTELDPLAKASLATRAHQAELSPGRFGGVPKRSPNREVNGKEGWVLESSNKETTFYEFGTFHSGRTVFLTFQYPTSHAAGEEWRESVLASVEWK